jgi:hypothetical protein
MIEIVTRISPTPSAYPTAPFPSNCELRQRVYMSWEFVAQRKPILAQYINFPLMAVYPASELDMQEWILEKMNEMEEYKKLEEKRFTSQTMSFTSGIYTCEGPHLTMPT